MAYTQGYGIKKAITLPPNTVRGGGEGEVGMSYLTLKSHIIIENYVFSKTLQNKKDFRDILYCKAFLNFKHIISLRHPVFILVQK
jgi:hypothetical protein